MQSIGDSLASFNLGMMSSMQADITATDTDCYAAADDAGTEIKSAFNLNNYAGGQFQPADFINLGQVVGIKLMEEFDKCGYNNFLVTLDIALSKIPQLVGTFANGATQTGANSDELQTSLAKGAQGLQQGFDYKDTNWQQYGADAQLALASLLKYESPDVFEDVSFTS